MGSAFAATYSYQPTTYAWETVSTVAVWTAGNTDDGTMVANLGFTFTFGGVAYTQVRISSNGFVHFGAKVAEMIFQGHAFGQHHCDVIQLKFLAQRHELFDCADACGTTFDRDESRVGDALHFGGQSTFHPPETFHELELHCDPR